MSKTRLLTPWLLLACGFGGCTEPATEPPVRPVRAMRVGDVAAIEGRWFPGRAKAAEEVNLSFRVGGELQVLPIDVGDVVKKGDVLAQLDPADFQAVLEGAEAKLAQAVAQLDAMQIARPEEIRRLEAEVSEAVAVLELAKSDYKRAMNIQQTNSDAISEMEVTHKKAARDRSTAVLDQTKESLAIARGGARKEDIAAKEAEIKSLDAEVAVARNNVKYTQLTAPFDGSISAKYVDNYQTVLPRQVVCRLLDSSKIEIVVDISESRISLASYIEDLVCVFDAFPDVQIEGVKIKEVGTEASAVTRTYPVTCLLDQPDPATGVKILPGMAGRVKGSAKLPDQVEEGGFLIPESAVFSDDENQPFVWVIDANSMTVGLQPVTQVRLTSTGMRVKGLSVGQLIATAGVDYLKDGQKVRMLPESGEEAK
jgi:RND family efflux transporter MFP subunit